MTFIKDLFDIIPWPLRWAFSIIFLMSVSLLLFDDRMAGKVSASENRMIAQRKDDMAYLRDELSDIKSDTRIIKQALIRSNR